MFLIFARSLASDFTRRAEEALRTADDYDRQGMRQLSEPARQATIRRLARALTYYIGLSLNSRVLPLGPGGYCN